MKHTLVLADDEPLFRAGLRSLLEDRDILVLAEASTGAETLEACRRYNPDVVLMDVRMPELGGIKATKALIAQGFHGKILVLTAFAEDLALLDAFRAGAAGFLLKSATPEEVVRAIEAAYRGEAVVDADMLPGLVRRALSAPGPAEQVLDSLTDRERQILACVGQGMTNPEIGKWLKIRLPTVRTHMAHLFTKLDVRTRAQAAVLAHEAGLSSRPPRG